MGMPNLSVELVVTGIGYSVAWGLAICAVYGLVLAVGLFITRE